MNFILAAVPSDVLAGIETVKDAATSNFTIGTIASALGITLAACAGLFIFWWASKKVIKMVKGAFTKGKLSVG